MQSSDQGEFVKPSSKGLSKASLSRATNIPYKTFTLAGGNDMTFLVHYFNRNVEGYYVRAKDLVILSGTYTDTDFPEPWAN